MIDELMRRDYCRLIAKKYGEKIFEPGGVLGKMTDHHNKDEAYLFKIWKESRTGVPVIDAAMKSLSATGLSLIHIYTHSDGILGYIFFSKKIAGSIEYGNKIQGNKSGRGIGT